MWNANTIQYLGRLYRVLQSTFEICRRIYLAGWLKCDMGTAPDHLDWGWMNDEGRNKIGSSPVALRVTFAKLNIMRSASGCQPLPTILLALSLYLLLCQSETDDAISQGRNAVRYLAKILIILISFQFDSTRRRLLSPPQTELRHRQIDGIATATAAAAEQKPRRCHWEFPVTIHPVVAAAASCWLAAAEGIPAPVFGSINTDFSHLQTWCYHRKALTPAPRTLLTQKLSFYCNWFSHPEERDSSYEECQACICGALWGYTVWLEKTETTTMQSLKCYWIPIGHHWGSGQ